VYVPVDDPTLSADMVTLPPVLKANVKPSLLTDE